MKNLIISIFIISLASCQQDLPDKPTVKVQPAIAEIAQPKPRQKIKDSIISIQCRYTDLSKTLDFDVQFRRVINEENTTLDSSLALIAVFDKKSRKQVDLVRMKAIHYYDFMLGTCVDARSYTTGKNKNLEIVDNDYGKFIVADFNFDALEDFAVMNEFPNSGVLYNYYLQNNQGKFEKDAFLTDSMMYFPETFNRKNKTLTSGVRCGACGWSQITYKYNPGTRSWKKVGSKLIDICEDEDD